MTSDTSSHEKQKKQQKAKLLYHQRDVSWLSFNARVLQEAADPSVPLLERLKFLAIYSSNLDEFYRVRVASLRGMKELPKQERSEQEKKPRKLLRKIRAIVDTQQQRFGSIFQHEIIPQLEANGVFLVDHKSLSASEKEQVSDLFHNKISKDVEAQTLSLEQPSPFLANQQLYLVVDLGSDDSFGLVNVPSEEVGRFFLLSEQPDTRVLNLDELIRTQLPQMFPGMVGAYAVKMSRDAELHLTEEYGGDLIEKIKEAVAKREKGLPTRFLYDATMPPYLRALLKDFFQLSKLDLIPGSTAHNFNDYFSFASLVNRPQLEYKPMPPLVHPQLERATSLLEEIWTRDHLTHYPYQTFDYLPQLLDEAIAHSDITHLCMTLYRTSKDSAVASRLLQACERGVQVTVFIEVKARFDEENNLMWGNRLRDAGAQVIYSFPGIKVHSKLLLIKFQKQNDIAYVGTGNFNEKTALIYSDHALLTSNASITEEVDRVFAVLDRSLIIPRTKLLLVSPFTLRDEITNKIDREIAHAANGKNACISFKMNSLEDRRMANKIYQAAEAGVKVRLIVRGICVLNTAQVRSKNLEVISIVDRFLEHSRIYHFENGGRSELYIGSADMMGRNLDRRIEVLVPIISPILYKELIAIFEMQWKDRVKARILDGKLANAYRDAHRKDKVKRRAQHDIYTYLQERISEI